MKYILLAFLAFPLSCYSQNKGDTKIAVTVTDTTGLLNKTALYLIERGYSLESKYNELNYLTTAQKIIGHGNAIKIKALVKDHSITFTGDCSANMSTVPEFSPIRFAGMKGSTFRETWDELNRIALHFGNEITYSK